MRPVDGFKPSEDGSNTSVKTRDGANLPTGGNQTYTHVELAKPPRGYTVTPTYCRELLEAALHAERQSQDIDSKAQRERFVVSEISDFLYDYFRTRFKIGPDECWWDKWTVKGLAHELVHGGHGFDGAVKLQKDIAQEIADVKLNLSWCK